MAIIVIRGNPDDSSGTMNKKCPQMLVAFFRHIHQHLPVATRMLAWNQTQPCSKVAAILKFSSFANSSNNGRGRFRTNAFTLRFRFEDKLTIRVIAQRLGLSGFQVGSSEAVNDNISIYCGIVLP